MWDQQIGLGNNKQEDFGLLNQRALCKLWRRNLLNLLQQLRGSIFNFARALRTSIGCGFQLALRAVWWLRGKLLESLVSKMKQLRSVTQREQWGAGRRSFHEWSQWEGEESEGWLGAESYYVGVSLKGFGGGTKYGCGLRHGSYKFSLIHSTRGEIVLLFTLAQGAQQPTV